MRSLSAEAGILMPGSPALLTNDTRAVVLAEDDGTSAAAEDSALSSGREAYARAIGDPDFLTPVIDANPVVRDSPLGDVLSAVVYGSLMFGSPGAAVGPTTLKVNGEFSVLPLVAPQGSPVPGPGNPQPQAFRSMALADALPTGDEILLGLLDPVATGNGFQSLLFQVNLEGSQVLYESFTDLATALAFFDDNIVTLGALRDVQDGVLDLEFILQASSTNPGDRFFANFLVGADLAPVPLPGTAWLFAAGAAAIGLRARRRGAA